MTWVPHIARLLLVEVLRRSLRTTTRALHSCSPRQSGAAGPCSTLRGCTARPDRRLRTAVSSAGRAESLGF